MTNATGTIFGAAIARANTGRPPVWFMRQAGRYHSHYQELKKRYTFMELCKNTDAACEATLGPIEDFGFDAAILFSDLLFPLEAMGMGLTYDEGPKLDWHLKTKADCGKLRGGANKAAFMSFQGEAMAKIRARLPKEKGLLGFVGGPLTLFCYAVEGSHLGGLKESHAALADGRFEAFRDNLLDLLAGNMAIQARGGADCMAIFDTCAGDFSQEVYGKYAVPALKDVLARFKKLCPDTPVTYYSKGTGPAHWKLLDGLPIDCLGVDWHHDLAQVLTDWSGKYAIQGNIDPEWLHLPAAELEKRLREVFAKVKALPAELRRGWVCGLGHGVLQRTPEDNVRLFLRVQKEIFGS